VAMVRMESSAGVYSGKSGGESMKRPQKLAVMLVPTPPYEICGVGECMEQPLSMRASGGAKIQMAQGRLISGSPSR
jgi:hypothetical protein